MLQRISVWIDSKFGEEIANSIKVDNINIPTGMRIEVRGNKEGVEVVAEVEYRDPKSILTLRNTVDEILEHIEMLIKVLGE
ncbi:hypothetical protein GWK48_02870 [Metallosphaera tengchongensis]|uniref:KEOPS complex subunit n=1 Tax=Metallosphaera tengchongensis TaxID=1532350 RepID=A0A6N0NTN1_9CREN|nr:KEOPS complex subunit Pcc1 [Metallosphaera tengchongensis]QKQ99476.1 hypothetical protein GWK48_02870 [Metallosphaera tengchongensis]